MSTLDISSLSDGTDSISSTVVVYGTALVWINLDGIGTVTEVDSYNVSSFDDDATGKYTANYTNSLSDSNYTMICNGPHNDTDTFHGYYYVNATETRTTSESSFDCENGSGTDTDQDVDATGYGAWT